MAHEPGARSPGSLALWRFSLRQLLIWTAAIAVGCLALRSATPGWVAAMFSLTLLLLATATLLAVFRQGADRAPWIGFTSFGWLYLLLLMFGWSGDPSSWDNPFRPYNLATAKLSAWLYDRLYAQPYTQYGVGGMGFSGGGGFTGGMPMGSGVGSGGMLGPMSGMGGSPGSGMAPTFSGPSQGDFINVAHALWTMLLATCGGWLARWIYATGPAAKKKTVDSVTT